MTYGIGDGVGRAGKGGIIVRFEDKVTSEKLSLAPSRRSSDAAPNSDAAKCECEAGEKRLISGIYGPSYLHEIGVLLRYVRRSWSRPTPWWW